MEGVSEMERASERRKGEKGGGRTEGDGRVRKGGINELVRGLGGEYDRRRE